MLLLLLSGRTGSKAEISVHTVYNYTERKTVSFTSAGGSKMMTVGDIHEFIPSVTRLVEQTEFNGLSHDDSVFICLI